MNLKKNKLAPKKRKKKREIILFFYHSLFLSILNLLLRKDNLILYLLNKITALTKSLFAS